MELMRLQKYLARAGVSSRRAAEGIITAGRVTVNGTVVTGLGTKVDAENDRVEVDGTTVTLPSSHTTLLLHKPVGYVTTMDDPQGRPTVAELVPVADYPGLYPVGRLDTDTTGLLLFTTDGELGNRLLHPRHHVEKIYYALVQGTLSKRDIERLRQGIELTDGKTLPVRISVPQGRKLEAVKAALGSGPDASGQGKRHGGKRAHDILEKGGTYVVVGLREGRKRQIRRMFEAVDHPVIALHREKFGSLELGSLARGSWRLLTDSEVAALREESEADSSAH